LSEISYFSPSLYGVPTCFEFINLYLNNMAFDNMKIIKTENKAKHSDDHLQKVLHLVVSNICPKYNLMVNDMTPFYNNSIPIVFLTLTLYYLCTCNNLVKSTKLINLFFPSVQLKTESKHADRVRKYYLCLSSHLVVLIPDWVLIINISVSPVQLLQFSRTKVILCRLDP